MTPTISNGVHYASTGILLFCKVLYASRKAIKVAGTPRENAYLAFFPYLYFMRVASVSCCTNRLQLYIRIYSKANSQLEFNLCSPTTHAIPSLKYSPKNGQNAVPLLSPGEAVKSTAHLLTIMMTGEIAIPQIV